MNSSLTSYRTLLRASRRLFRNDVQALNASREAIRSAFEENRSETSLEAIDQMRADAEEARVMLETNLLQATLSSDETKYSVTLPETTPDVKELRVEPIDQFFTGGIDEKKNPK